MALAKGKPSEIPQGAVTLTEDEALEYQMRRMKDWKIRGDILGFEAGPYLLATGSFFTGIYLNTYFRNRFKLYNYGKFATYLPVCVIPAVFSALLHIQVIVRDILLLNHDTCPVCLEMRAATAQTIVGLGFPLLTAPAATLSLVQQYGTYDLPYITKEPKKVFGIIKKSITPIANILTALFIGHALLGATVTYFEARSVTTVMEKINAIEEQAANS